MNELKPDNCNCQYPIQILRNMSGHSEYCPVHIEFTAKWNTKAKTYQINFTLDQKTVENLMENLGISIALGYIDRNGPEFIIFQQIVKQIKEQGYKK
jgi:hypothetical protein